MGEKEDGAPLRIKAMHVELGITLSCGSLNQTEKNYILKSYSTEPTGWTPLFTGIRHFHKSNYELKIQI